MEQLRQDTPAKLANRRTSFRHEVIDFYTAACRKYAVDTDAGVLVALRFGKSKLRVSDQFSDKGALPLAEVLLHFPELNRAFKVLDFSRATVTSHGAIVVSEVLHATDHALEELIFENNKIGAHGARAIVAALSDNSVTKVLNLQGCYIGEKGGTYLARRLLSAKNKSAAFQTIDLSLNDMGNRAVTMVGHALARRKTEGLAEITVDLDSNNLNAEIMNAVTHGIGFIFCILGSVFLGTHTARRGAQEEDGLVPVRHLWCTAVYCVSLCILYISSTLYHSFFALPNTRKIFSVFDQSAIYILIAGSYTPFLGITFPEKPQWSVYLLGFMWFCCCCGIYIEACLGEECGCCCIDLDECKHELNDNGYHFSDEEETLNQKHVEHKRARGTKRASSENVQKSTDMKKPKKQKKPTSLADWKGRLSLTMYLGMGWAAAFVMPDLYVALNANALKLLVAGGLCYTGGVPFFVRNKGHDHAIWHVFVLMGSICHYLAIYFYVIPL